MAASAWTVYTKAALAMSKGSYNLSTDTYQIILLTNSYTPDATATGNGTYGDISANELTTSGGYTVGGIALASVTDTASSNTVTFTSANPSWTTFTATLRYAAIIRRAGGSLVSGDLLLCYSDLTGSGSITGAGGTFTITMNGSGIFTITHSP